MARVPLISRDDLPEQERAVFDRLEASRGTPTGNIWRALANAPNLLDRVPLFADAERAVLRYAKEATEHGTVADATWEAMRGCFDDRKAMEIVITVAWY